MENEVIADNFEHVVYMIKSKDPNNNALYIGKTHDFDVRKRAHRYNCLNQEKCKDKNYHVYEVINEFGGWEAFEMTPIKICKNWDEATKIEREMIRSLKPYLNVVIPGRTRREYYEQHGHKYQQRKIVNNYLNKEANKIKWKERNDKTREYRNKKMRENYHNNREEILKKNKIKYWCVCGKEINAKCKKKHLSSTVHCIGVKDFQKELNIMKKEILRL